MTKRFVVVMLLSCSLAAWLFACGGGGSTADSGADPGRTDETPQTTEPPAADETHPGPAELQGKAFEALDEDILNPERGFYTWIDILDDSDNYLWVRDDGFALAYAEVVLKEYQDKDLNAVLLSGLENGFARARQAGIKLIPRFYYSDDPSNSDAPLARILGHIAQLKPILQDNADVIAALQAGFIGRWGEWHSSTNGLDNETSRAQVLEALLDAVPKDRAIQVRRPKFKADFFGSESPDAGLARIGHHNDCFLASDTDMGTYPSSAIDKWKGYIAEDGSFTPVGGETCKLNPPRTDCASATGEMAQLHWSFINILYREEVIAGWEAQACLGEVKKRLGYRIVLQKASWNNEVRPGGVLHLEAAIENQGYSPPFNARPIYAVLSGPACYRAKLGIDPKTWLAGQTANIAVNLSVPSNAEAGEYTLSLWLPDASDALAKDVRYSLRFANEGVWNGETGMNELIHGIYIDDSAQAYSINEDGAFVPCQSSNF